MKKGERKAYCKKGHPLTTENRTSCGRGGMTCKTCAKVRCKKWRQEHVESEYRRSRRYMPGWQKKNRAKIQVYHKRWYVKHSEEYLAKRRAQRVGLVGGRIRARYRKYTKQPKARAWAREGQHRRKARKLLNGIGDISALRKFFVWVQVESVIDCVYCFTSTTPDCRHVDHAIPLSRGGSHAVENLRISCPPCNMRKGNKTESEFLGLVGLLVA